jgi:hypothetical protein
MARALIRPSEAEILRENPILEFRAGKYNYKIERAGDRSMYTVSDGVSSLSAPIEWAFGLGDAGQTYVLRLEGARYESRVSFYRRKKGLDWTMGATSAKPASLKEAFGRKMGKQDERECFGCHSTGAVAANIVRTELLAPGVQCEACHGPGSDHIKGVTKMASLGGRPTEEISDLCGRCHRTWADVASMGLTGIANVRFQPYRIANSRCYDALDSRISCVACHDPHAPLVRAAVAYDAACTACHMKPAKICPAGKKDCVSCHMPKYEIPGSHFEFTDHQIRVVRPGEVYPN